MNVYFSPDKLEGRGEPHPEVMWAAELVVQGHLAEKDVPFLHVGDDGLAWRAYVYKHQDNWIQEGFTPVPRWHFILKAGFVVATVEWMDSIARLLRCMGASRVLDIGAGHGHLIKPMTARGLTWDAVDLHPVNHTVPQGDGPVWLAERGYDVGYLGWPPMSDLDKRCAATGKPLIIVGEPPGACTGSEDLDDEAHPWVVAYAADIFPGFRDVPRWEGLHDLTMVVATQEQIDGYIANWKASEPPLVEWVDLPPGVEVFKKIVMGSTLTKLDLSLEDLSLQTESHEFVRYDHPDNRDNRSPWSSRRLPQLRLAGPYIDGSIVAGSEARDWPTEWLQSAVKAHMERNGDTD